MTTGEKIQEIRKSAGLTQEQFAEKFNVSRQSVSKWESDITFPETQKLIEISKAYNVSIDYLLRHEKDYKDEFSNIEIDIDKSDTKEEHDFKYYTSKKEFPISCFLVGFFLLYLIMYLFSVVKLELPQINTLIDNTMFSNYYNNLPKTYGYFNFYQLLFSGEYQIGNFLILISFLLIVLEFILGIVFYFRPSKKIYRTIKLSLILNVVVLIFLIMVIFEHAVVGTYLILFVTIVELVLFFTLKIFKYKIY